MLTSLRLVLIALALSFVLLPPLCAVAAPAAAGHSIDQTAASGPIDDCGRSQHEQPANAGCDACVLHCVVYLAAASPSRRLLAKGPTVLRLDSSAPVALAAPVRFRPPITAS